MLQKNKISANDMLSCVAPTQAVTLLLLGPPVDKLVSHTWVTGYQWSVPAINALAMSCALAVGVNVTQFLCLGRFSALSFQASGVALLAISGYWDSCCLHKPWDGLHEV